MKRYEKYKPSGIEWIGEVPEHWELEKTKFVAGLCTGNSLNAQQKTFYSEIPEDVDCRPYVASKDIDRDTEFIDYENGIRIPIDGCSFEIAPANSTLLCIEGGSAGKKMGFVDREVCYVNKLCCYDAFNIKPKFLYYFIKSKSFWEIFSQNIQGMIGGVSVGVLKEIKLPIPAKAEQEAIAAYLDVRCADIDKVVATQQKRIALLQELKQSEITKAVTRGLNPDAKMKDSGVEWIGEVPEGWEIRKLKHLCGIFGRIGYRGYNTTDLVLEGEGAITLSPSNIQERMIYDSCTYLSWDKYYESPEIMIQNGDILFVKTGSSYGKCTLVTDLPMEATINPQIVVFKNIIEDSCFLDYSLHTPSIEYQVENTVIGSTIPTISQEKIGNYVLPIPPKEEQAEIVEYLDRRCGEIDKQITAVTRQIELLREYKQALITEVVTGKRKVE